MDNSESEDKQDRDLDARIEILKTNIAESFKIIEENIRQLGSFNVIANISYINQSRNLSDYQDYKEGTLPVVSEYVALLCLKNPFFYWTF